MKHFQFSRVGGSSLLVAGGVLALSFAGCGGGGTGTTVPTSRPSATPVATSVSAQCDASTYTPNYYGLPDPSAPNDPNIYTYWRQFPVAVFIPASGNTAFRNSTIAGFNQWVSATNSRASYQLVSSASDADLVVSYSAQDPNSDTLGLTTVTYNANQKFIISAKMEMFFYTTSQRPDANAVNQSIAAHEFGHALGISPHSPYEADLMFPTLERAVSAVTTRDLNTLKTVYCNNFPTRATTKLKNEGPVKTLVIRN